MHRLGDGNAPHKRGHRRHWGPIGAEETYEAGVRFHAHVAKDVDKPHSCPTSLPDGAALPLGSGDTWAKKCATVARALKDRGDGHLGEFLELVESETKRAVDEAAQIETERAWVNDGRSKMAPDEEDVVWRKLGVEQPRRGLEVLRPHASNDEAAIGGRACAVRGSVAFPAERGEGARCQCSLQDRATRHRPHRGEKT